MNAAPDKGTSAPAADGPAPVLSARGVYRFRTVDRQQVPIVRDVTFALMPGEFAAVMGPSGSGKSTLLHLLAGLDRPSAGDIQVAGVELSSADEEQLAAVRRRHIGFIFQFFHLLPDLTVMENVTLPLRILGENVRRHRDRIAGLLELLGIGRLLDRQPSALSGGEMQRVSIARALSTEPPLLLCDEPTGNLSSKHGEEVVRLLREVQGRLSTAVLLVTHNPRDAAAADRVVFLHDGALRAEATMTKGPFGVADVFVVWKSWASNRLRTGLTLLGIALGTAIVVAIYVMDHNTIQTRYLLQNPERGPVDLELAPAAPKPRAAVVDDLRARSGIAQVAIWREARAQVLSAGGASVDVQVFGLEPLPALGFAHYELLQGRDLADDDGEGAVLLGAEAARILAVAPGDAVTLRQPQAGARFECKDGQLRALPAPTTEPLTVTVTVAGVLAPQRLGRRNFGQVVVGARALAERLVPGASDWFHVRKVYGADLDRLQRDLRAADYVVADQRQAQLGEAADERAFRNGIKVLGCLALLLGMFVVFQTLSHSLVARVRLLGLLRCLGASGAAVGRIFLGEALLLGVLGSALGLGLGIGLAALLAEAQISSLGGGKAWLVFELPLVPMLWTAGLGVLFTVAGALFPLWRARQLPALWILRQRGLGQKGDGQDLLKGVNLWLFVLLVLVLPLAYLAMTPLVAEEGRETLYVLLEMGGMVGAIGGLLLLAPAVVGVGGRLLLLPARWLWPLPTFLCGKSVHRQAGRIAAGVVGLSAVLLAFLGLESITASLHGDVRAFAGAALHGRAFTEVPVRTAAACADWLTLPGVAAVEPIEGEVHGSFLLRGFAVEHAAAPGGALEGLPDGARRYADPRVRTLVASRRLALKMDWRDGSLVALRDRNQVPVSYEVLCVSDRSGYVPSEQAWAICSPHWLRTDFCIGAASVTNVTLRLDPGVNPDLVGDRLRGREPAMIRYKTGAGIEDYHQRDVNRDFYLFELLLAAILVLAGTGLLNGMTISAIGRVRELGTLRALGVGPRELRRSLLLEGLVTGLLAAALALALAVPVAHVLVAGLNRVAALQAPTVLPVAWFWLVPAIGVVVGVAAAWLPAQRAARQDPASAVRYE
ncbi:MAG: ATP-binding cassette domain-containing protein [Planctomycetota bacterium]